MRTNIVIDDELMKKAMELSGISRKKDIVHLAISEFIAQRMRHDLRDLRGKIQFAEGYDYKSLRKGHDL